MYAWQSPLYVTLHPKPYGSAILTCPLLCTAPWQATFEEPLTDEEEQDEEPWFVHPSFDTNSIVKTFAQPGAWDVVSNLDEQRGQLRCLREYIKEYIMTTAFVDTPPPQATDAENVTTVVDELLADGCASTMKDRYLGMNLKTKSKRYGVLPYSVPWVELVTMFFLAKAVTRRAKNPTRLCVVT